MNCPGCGVDIDAYQKRAEEWQRHHEKEEEFERVYGEQLHSIRQKRAWISGIVMGLSVPLVACSILLLIFLSAGVPVGISWKILWEPRFNLVIWLFFTFICFVSGFTEGKNTPGKQEIELRKSSGL